MSRSSGRTANFSYSRSHSSTRWRAARAHGFSATRTAAFRTRGFSPLLTASLGAIRPGAPSPSPGPSSTNGSAIAPKPGACRQRAFRRPTGSRGSWRPAEAQSANSMDGVQYDYRYLAFGLELIIGVRRPMLERLVPKSAAFITRRRPGPGLQLLGPDLHLNLRVVEDIAVPSRVFGRAALRGDYEVTVAVRSVKQREDELIAGLSAGGGQQQRRRRDLAPARHVDLVHVPFGSAAGDIAVGVRDHPVRQVRSEFR